jgi:hypothetical protein
MYCISRNTYLYANKENEKKCEQKVSTVILCHKEIRKCYTCPQMFIFRDKRHSGALISSDETMVTSSLHVCMYVCMHVCMYVCMYVRMYVCVCVCMYRANVMKHVFRKSVVWIQLLVNCQEEIRGPSCGNSSSSRVILLSFSTVLIPQLKL